MEQIKIGILTFSAAHNFGAILQCYGLYSTLCSMGHDVKVIDYRPSYLATYEPKFGWRQVVSRHIGTLRKRWNTYSYWRRIYEGYMTFKEREMIMTPPVLTPEEFEKVSIQFDCIVVGSDQIWNPNFNGNDTVWFGGHSSPNIKMIAYGASAGNPSNLMKIYDLTNKLNRFSAISVREPELSIALSKYVDSCFIQNVLDPSLLADNSVWEKWIEPIEKGDYILTYQARESNDVFRIAESLAEQLKCSGIIPVDFYGNVEALGYKSRITSPSEFISLVKNARCVVTTSFHGTAFSIILGTPFYTIRLNDGADNRSAGLLESLGLLSRMIDYTDTPTFSKVEFDKTNSKLTLLRASSLEFLTSSLV
ncbi:polysaccharide pyruvyl transferase family protein [uncultured Duncaniella sp.]|uniref:polysaccharide pyruvyl transferase family protein n=1 Tax=uncultured Duncaniella sp. TaxID=2768039 RepID=UPI002675EEC2|nr:polysaccharide pyruvyl transferase family protein [uncultured Duncaniella sp.]